jgi:23S rRNA (uracil1939-C5)-methyltransferase
VAAAGVDPIEIELTGLAYGGEAFGRHPDGRMVFVAFGLPGERVRVSLTDTHQRWARARLQAVVSPAPNRTEPRCRHFGICGGCAYQHMPYDDQLAAKRSILEDQLRRLGGFNAPAVQPTIPSPDPWGYRSRLRFGVMADGRLAFHERATGEPFPVEECLLPIPEVGDLWPRLALQAIDGVQAIEVRADGRGEPTVILHAEHDEALAIDLDLPASVIWLSPSGADVLAGDPFGMMTVAGRTFRLSAASFFQTNPGLIPEMVERVVRLVDPAPGRVVFDLYAGVGLFSAFFAQAGARVVAVEESASACADYEVNLAAFDQIELYESTVVTALPALPREPFAVLVDPPRAGLAPAVVDGIVSLKPGRLVYVSCDPATFARDGKRLAAAGYHPAEITPIDMFPQTAQIESVSLWLP